MVDFNYMYTKYFGQVCAIVGAIIKDDPRDIAQIAFHKLSQNCSLPNEVAAACFVRKAAKHMAIDRVRHRSVRRAYVNHVQSTESEADNSHNRIEASESERVSNEVILFILDEVNKLPPMAQKCFKLYYYKGKTSTEIAAELNLSQNTITRHLYEARQKLKMEILFHKKDALQFAKAS